MIKQRKKRKNEILKRMVSEDAFLESIFLAKSLFWCLGGRQTLSLDGKLGQRRKDEKKPFHHSSCLSRKRGEEGEMILLLFPFLPSHLSLLSLHCEKETGFCTFSFFLTSLGHQHWLPRQRRLRLGEAGQGEEGHRGSPGGTGIGPGKNDF